MHVNFADHWARSSGGNRSLGDLGQQFHAMNVGGDALPPMDRIVFNAHDRSLAAHPTLVTLGDLGRENQNHLKFTPFSNLRIGIEEDSAFAEVPREARDFLLIRPGTDGNRHLDGNTFSGATLSGGTAHKEPEHTTVECRAGAPGWKNLALVASKWHGWFQI